MRLFLFAAATACVTLAAASDATAQLFPLFPQVRANIQANRAARNQTPIATQQGVVQTTPNGYGVGQSGDGWVAPVISIGRASGTWVEGTANNPFQVSEVFAGQPTDRIRVVSDLGYYTNYYSTGPNGDGQYIGGTYQDYGSGRYFRDTATATANQNARRQSWGNSTGGTSRNSSASTNARTMQMMSSMMSNSMRNMPTYSSSFSKSSNAATSNLGASLRSSMSGSSGGGGGGAKVFFDDNAPGKKR